MSNALCRCNSSGIGLAELIQTLHELNPKSDEIRALIAEALGFGWERSEEPSVSMVEQKLPTLRHDTKDNEVFSPTPELKVPAPLPDSELTELPGAMLEPIEQVDPEYQPFDDLSRDRFLASAIALEPTKTELHIKRPEYQPLLLDRWFRGLMGAMLATPKTSQEVDWTVLIRDLARGKLLDRLPFRRRPTLQRGVFLFLDHSDSMQPFWRDEKQLLLRLQHFLGKTKVRRSWVEVDIWSPKGPKLRKYSPLPNEFPEMTPLLIVSDFGIGGDLSSSQAFLEPWLPLIDRARKNSCPIVALIPAPSFCWPKTLVQHIPNSFVWDRGTSTATARRRHRIS
jgi:hypothetical protein